MLDKIKTAVFAEYRDEEVKGVFMSWFSEKQILVVSNGTLVTDKPLHETLDIVYTATIEEESKKIRYVACDVVTDVLEITNLQDVLAMSPVEYGFVIVDKEDDISGVILPNTAGVADAKSALAYLKKKYGIHGDVEIYAFRTNRIVITK